MGMTFEQFCYKILDGLFNPECSEQSTGYMELKIMIRDGIEPASKEECERWETSPTKEELLSPPHRKYLRFLHPKVRPLVREHWDKIKKL